MEIVTLKNWRGDSQRQRFHVAVEAAWCETETEGRLDGRDAAQPLPTFDSLPSESSSDHFASGAAKMDAGG